jgi:DNA-binding GntR family transcriptional regulator
MSKQPLYRVIAEAIEVRIANGGYATDTPLPPEPALEKEFGVSRITIRKALDQLKQRGLLYSRSGKGTIVRTDALVPQAMKITCSIAELSYYAQSTVYSPLGCAMVPADERLAEKLLVAPGQDVLCMTGTRGAGDGPPFAFEEIYVPQAFCSGIDNWDLNDRTIFGTIEKMHGVSIEEVRQVVTAIIPDKAVRGILGLTDRDCCLRAVRLYLTRDGRPVELAVVHYDSKKFELTTIAYAG